MIKLLNYTVPKSFIKRDGAEGSFLRTSLRPEAKTGLQGFLDFAESNGLESIDDLRQLVEMCNPTIHFDKFIIDSDILF